MFTSEWIRVNEGRDVSEPSGIRQTASRLLLDV
jgi:hypothetical protein